MKKLFVMLVMLFVTTFSVFADSLTEMEEWKAKKVAAYLQAQVYMMPYCDCCENSPLEVVEIYKVSIEPADRGLFQVRVTGKEIAIFGTTEMGRFNTASISDKNFNDIISLNYTFVADNKHAVSIATKLDILEVEGYEITSCQQFINLPAPTLLAFDGNRKYKNWYDKQDLKLDYNSLLAGTWILNSIQGFYNESIFEGDGSVSMHFNADQSYVMLPSKDTGTWSIEDNELIIKADNAQKMEKSIFFLTDSVLRIKTIDGNNTFGILNFARK